MSRCNALPSPLPAPSASYPPTSCAPATPRPRRWWATRLWAACSAAVAAAPRRAATRRCPPTSSNPRPAPTPLPQGESMPPAPPLLVSVGGLIVVVRGSGTSTALTRWRFTARPTSPGGATSSTSPCQRASGPSPPIRRRSSKSSRMRSPWWMSTARARSIRVSCAGWRRCWGWS